jgi:hypothetical protein
MIGLTDDVVVCWPWGGSVLVADCWSCLLTEKKSGRIVVITPESCSYSWSYK